MFIYIILFYNIFWKRNIIFHIVLVLKRADINSFCSTSSFIFLLKSDWTECTQLPEYLTRLLWLAEWGGVSITGQSSRQTALWLHCDCTVQSWTISCFASCLHRHADGRTDGWMDCKIRRSCILTAGSCPDSTRDCGSLHKCVWKFATKSDDTSASWKQQPAAVTLEHSHISNMHGHTLIRIL